MIFLAETNFVEMLIAKMSQDISTNGLHRRIAGVGGQTGVKRHDSHLINKATAAILVKIRSIFWGDPRCGKKFEINTCERDRRTRFSPLQAQMIGAYKS